MALTLKEAIAHADLIKQLDCKICGKTIYINERINLIFTIRNNGICPTCQHVLNWVETHGGKLPTYDEVME